MNKFVLIGLIAATVLAGGAAYVASQRSRPPRPAASDQSGNTSQGSVSVTSKSTTKTTVNGQTKTTIAPVDITITASDTGASPTTVTVVKGAEVTLTFKVSPNSGGLEFRSDDPSLTTGLIRSGQSKTLQFSANQSVKFTPYRPSGDRLEGYAVQIRAD
ncbi:MAG TPA: hypothetical protein VK963_01460 [Candidatus Saccharimonadales bacterium]|nr:hypothetical protein [Candidatus Saccharimonadales bacterium]